MTECYIQHEDGRTQCKCDNCGFACTAGELHMIADIQERLTPGGVVPAGQCPGCGALSYLVKAGIAVILHKHMSGHSYGVAQLLECADGITRAIEFKQEGYEFSPVRFTNKADAIADAKARGPVCSHILVETPGLSAFAVIPKATRDAAVAKAREAR